MKNKHQIPPAVASNPHPYVNPYMNNATHPHEKRAPTTISVGPNGPTNVSVPPQRGGLQHGSGIEDHFPRTFATAPTKYAPHPNPYVNRYMNNATHPNEKRAPTTISVGPNEPMAPTTVSFPPVRSQQGSGIDVDDEDMDTEQESDSDNEDEEDKDPDVNDILVDISTTFHNLQHLRKQYRNLLPQLKEFKKKKWMVF